MLGAQELIDDPIELGSRVFIGVLTPAADTCAGPPGARARSGLGQRPWPTTSKWRPVSRPRLMEWAGGQRSGPSCGRCRVGPSEQAKLDQQPELIGNAPVLD